MKKSGLIITICLVMAFMMLPATSSAISYYITIEGRSLTESVPYYCNDGTTYTAEAMGKSGKQWNAYYEMANGKCTLHLRNFNNVAESQDQKPTIIDASYNGNLLYLDLQGNNTVTTNNYLDDSDIAGILCRTLIITGKGSLTVSCAGWEEMQRYGIKSESPIQLMDRATLTVSGTTEAANQLITTVDGSDILGTHNVTADTNDVGGTGATVIDTTSGYNNDNYAAYKYIKLTPKAAPIDPEPSAPGGDSSSPDSNPATGDDSQLMLWMSGLIMTAAGVLLSVLLRRRDRS